MGWKKGNVVMESWPYSHVIMQIYREDRCNLCLKSCESLKRCAACKKIWYCRQQCQKEDWKIHKTECLIFQRVPDLPTDSIRLYLRLILLHQLGKAEAKLEKSESPCLRSFNDLQSHCEEISKDEQRWELFQIASDFIRAYTNGVIDCPNEKTMLDIFGKMVINTFTLTDEMLQDVAVGVFNSPSILDHRCNPNAVASFEGRRLTIRLLKDEPSEDFSQVYLCYIDPLALTEERQEQLQKQYYFTCSCNACLDTQLDQLMTVTDDSSQDDVEKVRSCLQSLEKMQKNKEDPKTQVVVCTECLSGIECSLPETEINLVRVVGKAFDAAIEAQMWEEARVFGLRKLVQYRALVRDKNPGTGLFYANLGKLLVFLEEVREAQALLKQALEIFLVTLGDSHTLTRQVIELLQQCRMEIEQTGS